MPAAIILKNDIAEVQRLKDVFVEYGKAQHLSDELIQDVHLVLEEIVSNTIFYGYGDDCEHQIEVDVAVSADTLVIEIRDDAQPFNPLAAPAPDLDIPFEDREIGGMGIHLVRTLMDDLAYRNEAGQNVLTLKKHLRQKY